MGRNRNKGKESPFWKGEKAGYGAVHTFLTKNYKKKDYCENCKTFDFSRIEWANISGKYHREREDYWCLCPPWHRKLDLLISKPNCPQGHIYDKNNTYYNTRGHRQCRTCVTVSARKCYMKIQLRKLKSEK